MQDREPLHELPKVRPVTLHVCSTLPHALWINVERPRNGNRLCYSHGGHVEHSRRPTAESDEDELACGLRYLISYACCLDGERRRKCCDQTRSHQSNSSPIPTSVVYRLDRRPLSEYPRELNHGRGRVPTQTQRLSTNIFAMYRSIYLDVLHYTTLINVSHHVHLSENNTSMWET